MWLRPDEAGLDPAYEQRDAGAVGGVSGLVPLVSGIPALEAPVRIHTSGAALHLARLAPAESVALPDAARLHVFVARGAIALEDGPGPLHLAEGDAARLTGEGGRRLSATAAAEVLVWQLGGVRPGPSGHGRAPRW
jgi:hypothetical protein